jgi:hypothetical protein
MAAVVPCAAFTWKRRDVGQNEQLYQGHDDDLRQRRPVPHYVQHLGVREHHDPANRCRQ